jgi:HAMP domain-containing protein
LFLGALLVWIVNKTVSDSLQRELIERGRTIAINISQTAVDQIMAEDRIALRQLITANQNFESVDYILVQKSDGQFLADTFNGQVPQELTGKIKPAAGEAELVSIASRQSAAYDIWAPVEEGFFGYIRVGMKKDYVTQSVHKTNLIVIVTIIGITVVGLLIVVIIASRLIQPILYLTRRADEISSGELEGKIEVRTNDEIEKLGQALERLRESVKIALERLKKHQTLRM